MHIHIHIYIYKYIYKYIHYTHTHTHTHTHKHTHTHTLYHLTINPQTAIFPKSPHPQTTAPPSASNSASPPSSSAPHSLWTAAGVRYCGAVHRTTLHRYMHPLMYASINVCVRYCGAVHRTTLHRYTQIHRYTDRVRERDTHIRMCVFMSE